MLQEVLTSTLGMELSKRENMRRLDNGYEPEIESDEDEEEAEDEEDRGVGEEDTQP